MQKERKEIDIVKVIKLLKINFKKIILFTSLVTILSIIYVWIVPPTFTADIIIVPPKPTDVGSGLGNVNAGISLGLGGVGSSFTDKNSNDAIAMMKTREICDKIITKFNLIKYYHVKDKYSARAMLLGNTNFSPDLKTGFLTVLVDDKSPQIASDIANYYAEALGNIVSQIDFNKVEQKLKFYEAQLNLTKSSLNLAQDNLKDFALKNGITAGIQTTIVSGISTQLQAQLAVAMIQLKSMQQYSTIYNPDYQKLQANIDSLKTQILVLSGTKSDTDNIIVPSNLAPDLAQQYVNLASQVGLKEEVYKILLKQYEIVQLDKNSDLGPTAIEIISKAEPPIIKSKPQRRKIVLSVFFISLLLSTIFVVAKNYKQLFFTEKAFN